MISQLRRHWQVPPVEVLPQVGKDLPEPARHAAGWLTDPTLGVIDIPWAALPECRERFRRLSINGVELCVTPLANLAGLRALKHKTAA